MNEYNILYSSLSKESHLNMLQIAAFFHRRGDGHLSLPPQFTLHESSFYKNVNKVVIEGKEYTLPYQESFTMGKEK